MIDLVIGETSIYVSTAKIDVLESSIDSIQPNVNNKSSTLSGFGLNVRLG
jgi:hypothetical protein